MRSFLLKITPLLLALVFSIPEGVCSSSTGYDTTVDNFQDTRTFAINEPIPVKSKKGWLLIINR